MLHNGRACDTLPFFQYYDAGWLTVVNSGFRPTAMSGPDSIDFPPTWGTIDGFPSIPHQRYVCIDYSCFSSDYVCELARAATQQCLWESLVQALSDRSRYWPMDLRGWPIIGTLV